MMRGVAALMVVAYHYTSRLGELYPQYGSAFTFGIGHVGVHVFFVISGYVIFMTLNKLRAAGLGVVDFAKARFYRLYPIFWVAVGVTFALVSQLTLPGREASWSDALLNLTMIPRLLGANFVDGVYWSLEVELIFYFWIAAIYFLVPPRLFPIALFVWVLLGKAVAVLAPQLSLFTAIRVLIIGDWVPLFALGISIYLFHNRRVGPRTLFLFALVFCVDAFTTLEPLESVVVIICAGLIYLFTSRWYSNFGAPSFRPLVWFGAISYPLYLVHQNIGYALILRLRDAGVHAPIALLTVISVVIALSSALTYGVEKPIMRWTRRDASRGPAVEPANGV